MVGESIKKYIENNIIYSENSKFNYEQLKLFVSIFETKKYDIDFYSTLLSLDKIENIINTIINNKCLLNEVLHCDNNHINNLIDLYANKNNIDIYSINENIEYYNEDGTKRYLDEIGNKPLLAPEEEKEYFIKLKNGETKYRNIIIERNLRLVVSIANRYKNKGLSLDDLIEEGNIGLITAIEKFDINKNVKFSTYAIFWIKNYILEALREKVRMIRIPEHIYEYLKRYNKTVEKLESEYGRKVTADEIRKNIDLSDENIEIIKQYMHDVCSLNDPVGEDGIIEDFISDDINIEDTVLKNTLRQEIAVLLNLLTITEQKIIIERFGFKDNRPKSFSQISKIFNISSERIRQIEKRALLKLRKEIDRLKNKVSQGEIKEKNIFEYLDFYDLNIIKQCVEQLDFIDKELIITAFGRNYCHSIKTFLLNNSDRNRLFNKTIPDLKCFIMNNNLDLSKTNSNENIHKLK